MLPLPSWLRSRPGALPGTGARRRAQAAVAIAVGAWLLRPWPPFLWLPGWLVGGMLLWALAEAIRWQWWPHRWR